MLVGDLVVDLDNSERGLGAFGPCFFWLDLVLCFALKLRLFLVGLEAVHVLAPCSACLDAFYAVKHESLWDLQGFLRLICVLRLLEVHVWDSLADRRLICSSEFGLVFPPAAIRVFLLSARLYPMLEGWFLFIQS